MDQKDKDVKCLGWIMLKSFEGFLGNQSMVIG